MSVRFTSLAITLASICGCSKASDHDELSGHVYLHCSGFANDVDRLAKRYQSRVARPTSSDQERATADLEFQIKGREGRGVQGEAMLTEFLFCAGVKDADHLDPLRVRFSNAVDAYVGADDPAYAARLANEMAACVHELDKPK